VPGANAEYFKNKLNDLAVADNLLCAGVNVHALAAID
jgi:hypothetical protein